MTNDLKNRTNFITVLMLVIGVPVLCYLYFFIYRNDTFLKAPPIMGERKGTHIITRNNKEILDTIYHTIPAFSFISQDGLPISDNYYKDKIYVADFFFATCQSICPKMAQQFNRLQHMLKDDIKFHLLSHTVNPANDSVPVLRHYADSFHVDTSKWQLVTGDKEAIYKIAREGYLLPVADGDGGKDDFIHSEKAVLIDEKGRIRGFYDATDSIEIKRLADDIVLLHLQTKKLKDKGLF